MPKNQSIPKDYKSPLDIRETEKAIKLVKDCFERNLAKGLNLQRVSAPRFVLSGRGINDDLNGFERKVCFNIKYGRKLTAEVVFSLAKWKRMALADYGFGHGEGLYTDMDAIRPDEEVLDNLHSVYVDQWDWERIISKNERNAAFLKKMVGKIYAALRRTEKKVHAAYPELKPFLPGKITFVHADELAREYPKLTPKERECIAAKKYKAVFIIGIGGELSDGKIHDGRAPDYDDWSTETGNGMKGLNGDIIVWHPMLKKEFELSSMGIRVDEKALLKQLKLRKCWHRRHMDWHRRLLAGEFPYTIGGGIGQSRLCMFFLKKAHIGEVQSSVWPKQVIEYCKKHNIFLL